MNNNNGIERHKRILNIVSHLGLNKKKSTIPTFEKKRLSQSRVVFYKPEQEYQYCEDDKLIEKAKELLSKPLKRKHIRSESQLVQMISDKYDQMVDDKDENSAYHHIQLSLVKLQEQEILGQACEIKHHNRMSKTCYVQPLPIPSPKVHVQKLFEKTCSLHGNEPQQNNKTVRKKIDDFLNKTKASFMDLQVDATHYNSLKQHNRLYKQRTATYFQQ